MEDQTMFNLWKSYDQKLDVLLVMSRRNAEAITHGKVHSLLSSMRPVKIFTLIVGLLWVFLIDLLIVGAWQIGNPIFVVSMGIQVLLTKLAIGVYVYQLALIGKVSVDAPILDTQETIARLQASTIWITRVLFLQLPVWTTFFWSPAMLDSSSPGWFVFQGLMTGAFTVAAIWLFVNIRYENRNKRWFQWIFRGREWTPMIRAGELLEEVREYRGEE